MLVGQYLQKRDDSSWNEPLDGSDIISEVRTYVFHMDYGMNQGSNASKPIGQGELRKSNPVSRLFQSFDPTPSSFQQRPQMEYHPQRRTFDVPPPVNHYSVPPAQVVRREETNHWWQPFDGVSQGIFRAPIDQGPEKNEVNKRGRREDEPREVDCLDPHQLKRVNTVDNQDYF